MAKTFDEYKQNVVREYEKNYLIPQFGEGQVKENLLEGLVSILGNFSVVENINFEEINNSVLNRKIDYNKLSELEKEKGASKSVVRILHLFKNLEVKTPLDLIKIFSSEIEDNMYLYNLDGKDLYRILLSRQRDFGAKSQALLIDYLESEGFDFSREFAKKVMKSVGEK